MLQHVFHTSPQFIRGREDRRRWMEATGWEPPNGIRRLSSLMPEVSDRGRV